jgi:hypothetical protein
MQQLDEDIRHLTARLRGAICSIVFCVLLLVGFLVTPGFVRILNTEYWAANQQHGPLIEKLTNEIDETSWRNSKLAVTRQELANEAKKISDELDKLVDQSVGSITFGQTETKTFEDNRERMARARNELARARAEDRRVEKEIEDGAKTIETSEKKRKELQTIIERSASESTNLYLVARALALGAIGAIMSMLAKAAGAEGANITGPQNLNRMWSTMGIGAVVAVVALGLFHTKQISIFAQGSVPDGNPDFWRVTILCLMAGAFADRLFQAASGKVDTYLAQDQRKREPSKKPSDKATKLKQQNAKPSLVPDPPVPQTEPPRAVG